MAAVRVAVLGGGVAGCSFARQLSRRGEVEIHLYEMGRGPGGRTATRRSRETPLKVDHGAPCFDVRKKSGFHEVAESLVETGHLARVGKDGRQWRYFAKVEKDTAPMAFPTEGYAAYVGTPGMSALCDGLLASADAGRVTTHFATKVDGLEVLDADGGMAWRLYGGGGRDKPSKDLGTFDYLVVTGSGIAHPRWEAMFGQEAPLIKALSPPTDKVAALLQAVAQIKSSPVTVVFAQYDAEQAKAWIESAPFEVLRFAPHAGSEIMGGGYRREDDGSEVRWPASKAQSIVDGLVVRRHEDGHVTLVIHASESYSDSAKHVYGSGSTAALMGAGKTGESNHKRTEEELIAEVLEAASLAIDVDAQGAAAMQAPTIGPFLHRWGSAFPVASTAIGKSVAIVEEAHLLFAGDFVASERPGTIEGAALSAMDAADKLAILLAAGGPRL